MPVSLNSASYLCDLPPSMVSFVRRQVRDLRLYGVKERRSESRELLVVPVVVQPVDAEFGAIGGRFTVLSRDLSPSGIGLVHTCPIDHRLLALEMEVADELVFLVVEVVWCRPLGPFEYIGTRLVAKLDRLPEMEHCDTL